MKNIYKQKLLLRHYHHPLNKGELKNPDKKFSGVNISCGDELEIHLKLDAKKRIKEVGWTGRGCVISQAAMSIFSEIIKGKTTEEVQNMEKDELLEKIGLELSPNRIKCALLSLYTIKDSEKINEL